MYKISVFALFLALAAGIGCGKSTASAGLSVSGKITCSNNLGLAGVTVTLKNIDGSTLTTTTDGQGKYTFADLAANSSFSITASKTDSYYDAVTADDVTIVQNSTSSSTQFTVWQWLAMPIDASGNIDNALMKTLAQKQPLPTISTPVWRFFLPSVTLLDTQASGLSQFETLKITLTADKTDADMVGVKFGDVNGSFCQ